jgi:NADH-quinone oxidoreductase subunit M
VSALPATLLAGLLGCGLLTAVRPNLWLARAAALLWMFTAAWIGSLAASALGLSSTVALARMRRAFLRYATRGTVRGEGRRLPRMTALFVLFGAAAIGLPGSLSYVSEDLLLHGLLRSNPRGALALLIVTVRNGINVLRLVFTIFHGPSRARHAPRLGDLSRGEGLVAAALLMLSFAAGLAPRPLTALQAHSVRALAHAAGASSAHSPAIHCTRTRARRLGEHGGT